MQRKGNKIIFKDKKHANRDNYNKTQLLHFSDSVQEDLTLFSHSVNLSKNSNPIFSTSEIVKKQNCVFLQKKSTSRALSVLERKKYTANFLHTLRNRLPYLNSEQMSSPDQKARKIQLFKKTQENEDQKLEQPLSPQLAHRYEKNKISHNRTHSMYSTSTVLVLKKPKQVSIQNQINILKLEKPQQQQTKPQIKKRTRILSPNPRRKKQYFDIMLTKNEQKNSEDGINPWNIGGGDDHDDCMWGLKK